MIDEEALISELNFKAVRSSGSGGQNVNKVSSKIELAFNLSESDVLSSGEKDRLISKLSHRLTKEYVLLLQCDESRSQHKKKEMIIKRFLDLIKEGLKLDKKRIPTKIPKSVIRKRLKNKRNVSLKKSARRKPDLD